MFLDSNQVLSIKRIGNESLKLFNAVSGNKKCYYKNNVLETAAVLHVALSFVKADHILCFPLADVMCVKLDFVIILIKIPKISFLVASNCQWYTVTSGSAT